MNQAWRSVRAVAAGWGTLELLAWLPTVVLVNPIGSAFGLDAGAMASISIMVVLPIAAYAGGFVAATISGHRLVTHAMVCAALAVALRVTLALWYAQQGVEAMNVPTLVFQALWIVGFCGCGAIHARYRLVQQAILRQKRRESQQPYRN